MKFKENDLICANCDKPERDAPGYRIIIPFFDSTTEQYRWLHVSCERVENGEIREQAEQFFKDLNRGTV